MGKIFFAKMTSKDIKESLEKDSTVIIPVGATEVCGLHCPVGTDHLTAEEISRMLGEKTQTIVAPTIPVGDSLSLMGFPGTLTVNSESLYLYLRDMCFSLVANGFDRIFFINTHRYNQFPIDRIGRELKAEGKLAAQVFWWGFIVPIVTDSGLVETKASGHGGEVNTSVPLALFPDLVDLESGVKETPEPSFAGKYAGKITVYRDFADYSKTGTVGDPHLASAEKGKVFVEKALEILVEFLNEFKAQPLPRKADPLTKK